jgi:hypothetical protein
MKPLSNTNSIAGTSFFGTTFPATVNQLVEAIGQPTYERNNGDDKTNFEWNMELEDGTVFSIYDWKEYRSISLDEVIDWHIGGKNGDSTVKALEQLSKLIIN